LKLHLYHCDHLGTPVALINHKTGKVEWDAISDVWGNAVDIFNPYKLRQPIRMQGQHVDEESGLHYNRHRYYDPALGRYITQDPIGLRGGWNLYSYPLDPVLGMDPLGLTIAFEGDQGTQAALKGAYNTLNGTKHGHSMIQKMTDSEHKYIITGARPSDGNTCYDPTEFKIYIDVKNELTACVATKKNQHCEMKASPLSVVLGHEIGHVMGDNDDGKGMMNNVKKNENTIRKELGLPQRTRY
ncbi:RHS domain-containing protein, partial [Rahnella sp. PD12R]|uniref:RHS repeat-associated core domain-containing protein n=1 Tax=Rahnella sp. PD12R TaxID=2855688 RepID=UPI001C457D6A